MTACLFDASWPDVAIVFIIAVYALVTLTLIIERGGRS